jgi:polar amino acid transport system substrate-binding protein
MKRAFLWVMCLSMVLVSIGSAGSAWAGEDRWNQIRAKGKLVVGNCPEYPPFSFRSTSNQVEGFDSDFAKALGAALNLEVAMRDTAWEGLVAGMKKGDHDIIISCMSPEEATQASTSVAMSEPYYSLSEIIVTRKALVDAVKSKEDLAGRVIGVQANCTSEVAADSLKGMGIDVRDIRRYNRNSEALIDLKNGRVDAVVVGFAYAATQVKGNPDLAVVNDPVRSVDIVVVVDHGQDELVKQINRAIKAVKANGSFDQAYRKWLAL